MIAAPAELLGVPSNNASKKIAVFLKGMLALPIDAECFFAMQHHASFHLCASVPPISD
jgi:hypothetical protein